MDSYICMFYEVFAPITKDGLITVVRLRRCTIITVMGEMGEISLAFFRSFTSGTARKTSGVY